MRRYRYYIMLLITLCSLVSCNDDTEYTARKVEYCIRTDWENGREVGTRSISSLWGNGGSDLVISSEDYPATIIVTCDGRDFILSRSTTLTACNTHLGFYNGYTSNYPLMDEEAQKGITATAFLDDGLDELYCDEGDAVLDGSHLKLNFHHSKALLRFAFKIAEKYDLIRNIKITEITLNGTACTLVDNVLNKTDMQLIAYGYIDPTIISITSDNTLKCKYNIYDKDGVASEHLVRTAEATNTFTLGSSSITSILAGYYYDLNVTLDPDYLLVLSDHDNKHLTIE